LVEGDGVDEADDDGDRLAGVTGATTFDNRRAFLKYSLPAGTSVRSSDNMFEPRLIGPVNHRLQIRGSFGSDVSGESWRMLVNFENNSCRTCLETL